VGASLWEIDRGFGQLRVDADDGVGVSVPTLILGHASEDFIVEPGQIDAGDYIEASQEIDLTCVGYITIASIEIRGSDAAEFVFSICIDGSPAFSADIAAGASRTLRDWWTNVSKLSGLHTVALRLEARQTSRDLIDVLWAEDRLVVEVSPSIEIQDSVSASDYIEIDTSDDVSASDTVVVLDALSTALEYARLVSDSGAVADIAGVTVSPGIGLDSVAVSDSDVLCEVESSRTIADSATVGDAVGSQSDREISDAVDPSYTVLAELDASRVIDDSASASDSTVSELDASRGIDDSASASDSASVELL